MFFSLYILNRKTRTLFLNQTRQENTKMAKILREISEESEVMEKEIAEALSKTMNIPESSVSGKMVVNMAIKELHKKIVKNA